MDRYAGLLKQKDKALGIFNKVRVQLEDVSKQLIQEVDIVEKRIEEANDRIKAELHARDFLHNTRVDVEAKIKKIEALFG